MDIHNHSRPCVCTSSHPLLGPPLRWTEWEQGANAGRRLHSLLLPPSINPTSLILHLHYDRRLSPALFIISSSFTFPPPLSLLTPLFSTSRAHLCFIVSTPQVWTLTPPFPLASLVFSSFVNFTLESDVASDRPEMKEQVEGIT